MCLPVTVIFNPLVKLPLFIYDHYFPDSVDIRGIRVLSVHVLNKGTLLNGVRIKDKNVYPNIAKFCVTAAWWNILL